MLELVYGLVNKVRHLEMRLMNLDTLLAELAKLPPLIAELEKLIADLKAGAADPTKVQAAFDAVKAHEAALSALITPAAPIS